MGRLAGIRSPQAISQPEVEKLGGLDRPGYHIEKMLLKPETGIVLPALWFVPAQKPPGAAWWCTFTSKERRPMRAPAAADRTAGFR